MTITDDELARLEALAQAATPGPWSDDLRCFNPNGVRDAWCSMGPVLRYGDEFASPGQSAGSQSWLDSRFISAARDAVPALVAEVRRLRVVQAQLRNVIEARNGACDAYEAEAAELRASLADAVGKIARMQKIVDAADEFVMDDVRAVPDLFNALRAALFAYKASLPGLVRVK